jgi:DNA (cytosine-5)-methyltransferase 1
MSRIGPDSKAIPVIDLFAGPGGLGEGFSSLGRPEGTPRFTIRVSIEKELVAHQTLELRAFFRQFPHGDAPEEYYRHLRGQLNRKELFDTWPVAAAAAKQEAWQVELGKVETDAVRKRIRKELGGENRWVLIGGPPCQAYSNAGRSRNKGEDDYVPEDDPRQYLYVEYLQILADHRPAVFVMENVKGLLSATLNKERIFDRILADLSAPAQAIKREGRPIASQHRGGYRIYSLERPSMFGECDLADFVVRAERHGIPQARHRVILLGVRDDLPATIPNALPIRDPVPTRCVLQGLPKLRSGLSKIEDSPEGWKDFLRSAPSLPWMRAIRGNGQEDVYNLVARTLEHLTVFRRDRGGEFLEGGADVEIEPGWFLDERLGGICNHASRTHMPSDLHRYLYAACFADLRERSPNLKDFPTELLPNHRNVGKALEGGNFGDRFRVQPWSRPATTITSHISKDGHYYIHPDPSQCRSLTVREAARLQTFPDNYFFSGGRTAQYAQVGNAVPPLMATEIARIVHRILT